MNQCADCGHSAQITEITQTDGVNRCDKHYRKFLKDRKDNVRITCWLQVSAFTTVATAAQKCIFTKQLYLLKTNEKNEMETH